MIFLKIDDFFQRSLIKRNIFLNKNHSKSIQENTHIFFHNNIIIILTIIAKKIWCFLKGKILFF